PRFPVVALIHSIMDCAADGRSRDVLLGPPLCRIYEHSAIGPLPSNAAPPPSLRVFARRATKVLGWWMRGLARPNPFFHDRTKVHVPCRNCSHPRRIGDEHQAPIHLSAVDER